MDENELRRPQHQSQFAPIEKGVEQVAAFIQKRLAGEINGIRLSKFARLEKQLGGCLEEGQQLVIGARPSIGKTAFANSLIMDMCESNKNLDRMLIVYYTFEMSMKSQTLRFLSYKTGLKVSQIKSVEGLLTDQQLKLIKEKSEELKKLPIIFREMPTSHKVIFNDTKMLKEKHKDKYIVIIVDHIGLSESTNETFDERRKVTEMSRGLARIKKEFGTVNLILAQINRTAESQEREKVQYEPHTADLKESGSIEEDADTVFLLHRPSHYPLFLIKNNGQWYDRPNESYQNQMRVLIPKNRDGDPGGVITFDVDLSINKIVEAILPR